MTLCAHVYCRYVENSKHSKRNIAVLLAEPEDKENNQTEFHHLNVIPQAQMPPKKRAKFHVDIDERMKQEESRSGGRVLYIMNCTVNIKQ